MAKKLIWNKPNRDLDAISAFNDGYKDFMTKCKTEREVVSYFIEDMEAAGAVSLESLVKSRKTPKPGDLIYIDVLHKALMTFRIGTKSPVDGVKVLGAHIDSPRLDIKPNPLYEKYELALMDTHYYGGVKKYQWTTIPLAIHGVVCKKDGSTINVVIGEDLSDPVISITDLLPHLAKSQMEKTLADAITGENLDLLVGSVPSEKDEKDPVKANILNILKVQYGIEEDDFMSAELEIVPAGPARDHGLDRSMVLAYGQDDRICAYTSYKAFMDVENPEYTTICIFTDKEEVGSIGATGAHCRFFEDGLADLLDVMGCYDELTLRRLFRKSMMLSSDVGAAVDPLYPEVTDVKNAGTFGYGPVLCKYTGSKGKLSSNDAVPEYIAYVRGLLDADDVSYQVAELGRVDEGGGGTIAYILANLGMKVLDFGTALLCMHAPYEISSKADVYESYMAYKAFLKK